MCKFKDDNFNFFFFSWKATDNGGKRLVKQINEKSSRFNLNVPNDVIKSWIINIYRHVQEKTMLCRQP